MKTLLLTLEYPPFNGGVANYYANLVKYWPWDDGIEVINNNRGALVNNKTGSWFRVVGKILRRKKIPGFDYLLVGHILPLGTAAYLASFFKPFKYGVVLHGFDFTSAISVRRKRLLVKLILNKADKIVCANSRVAQMVVSFNPQLTNKITIINPGIDPLSAQPNHEKVKRIKFSYHLDTSFTLLTLGRLTKRKGVDLVIKALASPEFKEVNIKYFIAGHGEAEKYLRDLAKDSPLKDNIFFLGEVSDDDKWNWLDVCDVFIMPAREIGPDFEGFGIVYLEANLAGKAVIAGNSGGVKDAIIDGENGLLVNPESVEELKDAIIKLIQNKKMLHDLGERGKIRARSRFNWETQSKKLSQFIKK